MVNSNTGQLSAFPQQPRSNQRFAQQLPPHDISAEEEKGIATVSSSLDMSLEALNSDRSFLTAGGVFTDDMIDGYIELKMEEVNRFRMTTHPIEFDMYYSL